MDFKLECRRFPELTPVQLQAWRELLDLYPENRRAFLTPGFCGAVAAVGENVRVALLLRDGHVAGIFPFQIKAGLLGRLGVAEPVGGSMSDYFGLVAEPGTRTKVGEMLGRLGLGGMAFSHLDEAQAVYGLEGEDPRTGLRTVIGPSGETFWQQLRTIDKKLVGDTERRERKLASDHGALEFELASSQPAADLDELIRLKCSQYTRTGRERAPLFDPRNVALLNRLLQCNDAECSGLLSVLRVGGRLVAAHYGLRCYDMLHYWFPVYDAAFHAYSPGRILLKHVVLTGPATGIHVIDRGEGDTPAKRDFANEEHLFYRGLWMAPGLHGVVARLAMTVSWRLGRLTEHTVGLGSK